eukprot:3683506-Amphidinium_carterae.1
MVARQQYCVAGMQVAELAHQCDMSIEEYLEAYWSAQKACAPPHLLEGKWRLHLETGQWQVRGQNDGSDDIHPVVSISSTVPFYSLAEDELEDVPPSQLVSGGGSTRNRFASNIAMPWRVLHPPVRIASCTTTRGNELQVQFTGWTRPSDIIAAYTKIKRIGR